MRKALVYISNRKAVLLKKQLDGMGIVYTVHKELEDVNHSDFTEGFAASFISKAKHSKRSFYLLDRTTDSR